MKIGILKETKSPYDSRVVLSPSQILNLQASNLNVEFIVQESDCRVFSNQTYLDAGIKVKADVADCDILFGVKEVNINSLIPNKHYFFFGHIAKFQEHNRSLLKRMIEMNISFTDYEYLVDKEGHRLCAFGWWAGVVGAYNTIRCYGIKNSLFELPIPGDSSTLNQLLSSCKSHVNLINAKLVITGGGKVAQGAHYFLNSIGIDEVSAEKFLASDNEKKGLFAVLKVGDLVKPRTGEYEPFDRSKFKENPQTYVSAFQRYGEIADILLCCHYWGPNEPIYLSKQDLRDSKLNIRIIGDLTCDIGGSIQSTVRASTHDQPFYDYNPQSGCEEEAFSSSNNITVMAVDTLPNALPLETSIYFGEALIEHVLTPMLNSKCYDVEVIERATILTGGRLTRKFDYLAEFAS